MLSYQMKKLINFWQINFVGCMNKKKRDDQKFFYEIDVILLCRTNLIVFGRIRARYALTFSKMIKIQDCPLKNP